MVKSSYSIYTVPSDIQVTPGKFVEVNMGEKKEKVYFLKPGQTISGSVGQSTGYRFEYDDTESSGSNPPKVVATKAPFASSAVPATSSSTAASTTSTSEVPTLDSASSSGEAKSNPSVTQSTSTPTAAPAPMDKDEQIKAFIARVCDKIYWVDGWQTEKSSRNRGVSSKKAFSAYVTDGKQKHFKSETDGDVETVSVLKENVVDEFENLYWIYVLSCLYHAIEDQKKTELFKECGIDVKILKNLEKTGDLTFTYTERGIISNTTYKITVEDLDSNKARIAKVANATTVEKLLELLPAEQATTAGRRGHRRTFKKPSRRLSFAQPMTPQQGGRRRRQGFTLPMAETSLRKRSRRTHTRR